MQALPDFRPFRTHLLTAAALTVLMLLAGHLPGLRFFSAPESYLPLHIGLEFLAMTVSLMVFALSWNLRHDPDPRFMLLGIGFLCVALIDFGHMLSYQGMPRWITENGPEKAIQFWLAARFISAAVFLWVAILPLFPWQITQRSYGHALLCGLALSTLVHVIVLHYGAWLPATFVPGRGLTPLKIASEYVLSGLFALSALLMLWQARRSSDQHLAWLGVAAWTMGLAELFFTLYADVTDLHNLLGHLYKAAAYWMIYRGIFARGVAEPRQKISELAARMQSIIEATRVGTWEWNIRTGTVIFNERWAEIAGYRLEELSPADIQTWIRLAHPDDLAQSDQLLKQHFAGELPFYECEVRVRHKAGHWVWVLDRGQVVRRTPDGKPLLMSGTHQDISVRKQSELALIESERRFRALIRASAQIVWECDPAGSVTEDSPSWRAYTGQTYQEWSGYGYLNAIHPEDREAVMARWKGALAAGDEVATNLYRLQHVSGTWRWNSARAVPIRDSDTHIVAWVGMCTDIHEQHLAQLELEQHRHNLERLVESRTHDLQIAKEAAEAASRAKKAFLSMASHELRTPMNGIMCTLALAMRRSDDPRLLDLLGKADRASRQLLAIINDVLDIARIESDRLTLASTPFLLSEIRSQVTDALGSLAEAKQLTLIYPADPALETHRYLGDPTRLLQILMNLVGNALKFTERGSITVRGREIGPVSGATTRLHFDIVDTGIGIAPEDQARIFEPFEQADASISRRHGGTGLGLALCRRLVEAMEGRIGVDSQPGHGSHFWFEIVVGRTSPAPTLAAAEESAPGDELAARHHGANILVVEDEPLNQEITQIMLEDVGLTVFTASDGLEAVDCALSGGFDLILMDVNMPKLDGLEATERIRCIPSHRHTPIIAMTANAFIEDRDACIRAGMNDHIAKPVTAHDLYATLLRWLDHSGRHP